MAIEETPKSSELGFKHNEPCTLQITSSTVILILESSAPTSWPFNCIRRYKCHHGSFLLEVGRKAPTGEGIFCFFTQEGQDIFDYLGKSVADRMSTKQEQPKSDLIATFAALSTQKNENQSFPAPTSVAGKQNPFVDFAGSGGGASSDGVRFVMKRRTSSTPPPTPPTPPTPASNECARSPPQIEGEGGSYSHLRFNHEKRLNDDEEGDYNQLGGTRGCIRPSQTRLSENSRPNPSRSKALKVLGLLRSNSAENLQESSNSESCDLYSHLDFEKQHLKKSHSVSNDLDSDRIDLHQINQKFVDSGQYMGDNIYSRLNSEVKKKINANQFEARYNSINEGSNAATDANQNNVESTYDKLNSNNTPASHRHARPEPIIITDDSYNALDFAREHVASEQGIISNGSQPKTQPSGHEEAMPARQPFPRKAPQLTDEKGGISEHRLPGVSPSGKPVISKKPTPIKPPRKPGHADALSSPENAYGNTKDFNAIQEKSVGNDLKGNLISQLKKNFENQDQGRSSPPPMSPLSPTKRLVEPFYAVSPFASGSRPSQAVPSEYDVPTNNAPRVIAPHAAESKQQIDFLYAVSPFHSGNQKEVSRLDQNLYDTPSLQPADSHVAVANALNTYDTPVQRPSVNAVENLYDTPKQQNLMRMPQCQAKDRFPSPDKNMQFTYAVSPFAGAQNSANQIRFREYGYAQAGGAQEEAAYCEVPDDVRGYRYADGYDPVGGVLGPGEPTNEALYANPRE